MEIWRCSDIVILSEAKNLGRRLAGFLAALGMT
jgi:hypothetical protein